MKKETNAKSLFKNFVFYGGLQVINLLVGLVIPRLYLKVYGSEINGIISTANSFISYFSYIEAGLGYALMHALFKPLAENDMPAVSGIITYSKKAYRKISAIYFALVVALSAIFPLVSHTATISYTDFALLFLVIGAYGAIDFLTMAKYRVLLMADRKEYVISQAGIFAQILRFVLVWIVLNTGASVIVAKMMPILTLLVRSMILRVYVSKKYPQVRYNATDNVDSPKDTGKRWDAMFLQLSINASVTLPVIVISQVCGYVQGNVYAVYYMVCNAVITLISAVSSGISPVLGRTIAQNGDIKNQYDMYELFVSLMISILFTAGAMMIMPFIRIYTSVATDVSYDIPFCGLLIMLWGAMHTFRIPYTAMINAAALYVENRKSNITNLVVLIISLIVFTNLWGLPGAMISMLLTAVSRNISMAWILDHTMLTGTAKKSVLGMLLVIAAVFMGYVVGTNIGVISAVNTFGKWFFVAIPFTIVEAIGCTLLFALFNHKAFFNMVNYLFTKVKRVRRNR